MRRITALVAALLVLWAGPAGAINERGVRRALLSSGILIPTVFDSANSFTYNTPLAAFGFTKGAAPNGALLVASAQCNGTASSITAPSGWQTLSNPGQSSATYNYTCQGLFWKCASGEPATYTWANSLGATWQLGVTMVAIKNAACTAPQWTGNYVTASPATGTAITPNNVGGLVLTLRNALSANSTNFTTTFATGAGWTNIINSGTANSVAFNADYQNALTANTTSTVNASSSAISGGGTFTAVTFNVVVPRLLK